MKKIVFFLAVIGALSGCVDGNNYEATERNITVSHDKFTGRQVVTGPWTGPAGQERLIAEYSGSTVIIAAESHVTRDPSLQGSVMPRNAFVLGDTSPRQVQQLYARVECPAGMCFTKEAFRVNLTKRDIERGAKEGLEISFRGATSSSTMKVPAPYVQAFATKLPK